MGPTLLVLHDGESEGVLRIWNAAAARGCRVAWAVGWDSEVPMAPSGVLRRLGDVFDVAGLSWSEAVDLLAGAEPAGVVVSTDAAIPLAAEVAARLELAFHSPSTAVLLRDKLSQREALRDAGLPVPWFVAVTPGDPLPPVSHLPAVLKPRRGTGGRDTFVVSTEAELRAALATCRAGEPMLLEEWLEDRVGASGLGADVVSVETVVVEGVHHHVGVTGRFRFAPPCRETGSFFPAQVSADEVEALLDTASAALRALGVEHGVVHTEVKLTPQGPRLIEVNGRLGGGVATMLASLRGPDLTDLTIALALRRAVHLDGVRSVGVAYFRLVVAPEYAATVVSIEGVDELHLLPGVDTVVANRRPGDGVDARHKSYFDHVVRIDGVAGSYDDLALLVDHLVPQTLRVRYDPAAPTGG